MRKLNAMFHVEGDKLIKSTNGQEVPEDEPLFILRGRDALAVDAVRHYIELQINDQVPEDRIQACRESLIQFKEFKRDNPGKMKQPGIAHGR